MRHRPRGTSESQATTRRRWRQARPRGRGAWTRPDARCVASASRQVMSRCFSTETRSRSNTAWTSCRTLSSISLRSQSRTIVSCLRPRRATRRSTCCFSRLRRGLGGGLVVVGRAKDLQTAVVFGAELFGDLPVGAELFDQAGQGVQGFPQGDDLRAAALPLDGVLVVARSRAHRTTAGSSGACEQGHRDHGRGHEDDHVAVRERLARSRGSAARRGPAASDTAPRKPAAAMTVRGRAPRRSLRWRGLRSSSRMRYGLVNNQPKRAPITAVDTAGRR